MTFIFPIMSINSNCPKPGTPLLSPLRYPGSKRYLVRSGYVQETIKLNTLRPKLFVEPFAGGASVALQLLCDGLVDSIGLADVDPLIASFWKCVFYDTDWLVSKIQDMRVSLRTWEKLRQADPKSDRQLALKCLFLNRTSFSGILAPSAGPIGGRSQSSNYDIACRFPKKRIINRIRLISSLKEKVAFVWNRDWKETLQGLQQFNKQWSTKEIFIYLDPPFYCNAERLYRYYFDGVAHEMLHKTIMRLKYNWLLSYDAAEDIQTLYSSNGTSPKRVKTLYSVARSSKLKRSTELIITNLPNLPLKSRLWKTGR